MQRTKHKSLLFTTLQVQNKLADLTGLGAPEGDSYCIEVSGRISQKGLTPNSAAADNMKECCMW